MRQRSSGRTPAPAGPGAPLTAVLGDIVASRGHRGAERRRLQDRLEKLLASLNRRHARSILSRFVITEGDAFQALVEPAAMPDIVWDLEAGLHPVEVRLGIGHGRIETRLRTDAAVGMDGPAFHEARSAITLARKSRQLGGVFSGFGPQPDLVLNGLARLLWFHRHGFAAKQRRVAELVRGGAEPKAIARTLRITRQGVSDHLRSMGWHEYALGEQAWRAALAPFGRAPRDGA